MPAATKVPKSGRASHRPNDRLPRSSSSISRGHEVRIGLLGSLGLLVLVIGVPVALVLFVGYPLPRTAPSKDWLTTSITATLIIKILACVVWLVWAHFVICIVAECAPPSHSQPVPLRAASSPLRQHQGGRTSRRARNWRPRAAQWHRAGQSTSAQGVPALGRRCR